MNFYKEDLLDSLKKNELTSLPESIQKKMSEYHLNCSQLLSLMEKFEKKTKEVLRISNLQDQTRTLFADIYGSQTLGEYFPKVFALISSKNPTYNFSEMKQFCSDFSEIFKETQIYIQAYNPFSEETNRRLTDLLRRRSTTVALSKGEEGVKEKGTGNGTIFLFLFLIFAAVLLYYFSTSHSKKISSQKEKEI